MKLADRAGAWSSRLGWYSIVHSRGGRGGTKRERFLLVCVEAVGGPCL
jgi:hypothetical protein